MKTIVRFILFLVYGYSCQTMALPFDVFYTLPDTPSVSFQKVSNEAPTGTTISYSTERTTMPLQPLQSGQSMVIKVLLPPGTTSASISANSNDLQRSPPPVMQFYSVDPKGFCLGTQKPANTDCVLESDLTKSSASVNRTISEVDLQKSLCSRYGYFVLYQPSGGPTVEFSTLSFSMSWTDKNIYNKWVDAGLKPDYCPTPTTTTSGTLSVTVNGKGRVVSDDKTINIDCDPIKADSCKTPSVPYPNNTQLTLTATPPDGATGFKWEDCVTAPSTANPLTLSILDKEVKNCVLTFSPNAVVNTPTNIADVTAENVFVIVDPTTKPFFDSLTPKIDIEKELRESKISLSARVDGVIDSTASAWLGKKENAMIPTVIPKDSALTMHATITPAPLLANIPIDTFVLVAWMDSTKKTLETAAWRNKISKKPSFYFSVTDVLGNPNTNWKNLVITKDEDKVIANDYAIQPLDSNVVVGLGKSLSFTIGSDIIAPPIGLKGKDRTAYVFVGYRPSKQYESGTYNNNIVLASTFDLGAGFIPSMVFSVPDEVKIANGEVCFINSDQAGTLECKKQDGTITSGDCSPKESNCLKLDYNSSDSGSLLICTLKDSTSKIIATKEILFTKVTKSEDSNISTVCNPALKLNPAPPKL